MYFWVVLQSCEQLAKQRKTRDSLMAMVRTYNAVLQKVVVKVIHCMLQESNTRWVWVCGHRTLGRGNPLLR
jgi:hypothetical protein